MQSIGVSGSLSGDEAVALDMLRSVGLRVSLAAG